MRIGAGFVCSRHAPGLLALPRSPTPHWVVGTALVIVVFGVAWATAGAPGAPAWALPEGHAHASPEAGHGPREPGVAWFVHQGVAPETLHVRVGEPVKWTNQDDHAHRLLGTGWGGDGSGDLGPGESWFWKFDAPGVYEYRCPYHSWQDADGAYAGQVGRVVVEA